MKKLFYLFLFTIPLLGSQCQQSVQTNDFFERNTEWQQISSHLEYRELPLSHSDEMVELLLYRFSPDNFHAAIHHSQPKRFDLWQEELETTLLINGGFFTEQNDPTGGLIILGQKIGSNEYSSDTSGIFLIDDGIASLTQAPIDSLPKPTKTTSLLQSFPLLIKKGGLPGIEKDSEKIARRTVLAQTTTGEMMIIFVDQTPISLYTLMNLLLNSDLSIDLALNLDGGPSSGLIANHNDHSKNIIPLMPLPQVVSFSVRPRD